MVISRIKKINDKLFVAGDQKRLTQLLKGLNITQKTIKEWLNNTSCCSNPDPEIQVREYMTMTISFKCSNCNYQRFITSFEKNVEFIGKLEPTKQIMPQDKEPQKSNRNLMLKLYGSDAIPMGKLRTKVFNHFFDTYKKKHLLRPHPDGYLTVCLFCGGKLLINKFTGNTYCYICRRELPFEYLFEILKGCDIFSIINGIESKKKLNLQFLIQRKKTVRPIYEELLKINKEMKNEINKTRHYKCIT